MTNYEGIIGIVGAVVGIISTVIANRSGVVKLPTPIPTPTPLPNDPTNPPAPDAPAVDFLNWLLRVKAGQVQLDALDKEVLKSIKAALPAE